MRAGFQDQISLRIQEGEDRVESEGEGASRGRVSLDPWNNLNDALQNGQADQGGGFIGCGSKCKYCVHVFAVLCR